MNEQELNKKLAQWAGRIGTTYPDGSGYRWIELPVEGEWQTFYELPDFTHSLDSCFRWLVPRLEPLGYELGITNDSEVLGWRVSLHNIKSECSIASPYCDCQLNGIALALCLAISKLIGQDVHNGKHEG